MRIENTSEAQRHITATGGESVMVPAKRDGVNGSVEVSKAFLDAAKADVDGYVKAGVLVVVDGPKVLAPVKTDDEKASANVADALARHEHDSAAKDKPKK